jgi:hypothetical protein
MLAAFRSAAPSAADRRITKARLALVVSTPSKLDGVIGNPDDEELGGVGVKDNADTTGAVSKIAAIRIDGIVLGTANRLDTAMFAIAAQHIVSLKVGAIPIRFMPGASNDLFDPGTFLRVLGTTGGLTIDSFDFHAFEVPLT